MSPLRGILLKVISVTVFMAMASLIKSVSGHVPPGEAVFFRALFAMPTIVIWIWVQGELRTGLIARDPVGHVWRGLVGSGRTW